jgi:GalNAc-alpha-(1->4)-GalNAc-alpha-(1->3)-diNAcBac-PP-undecaprenol alpha-1,4-N-acetyl-D-galactosaminyltransferase
VRKKVVFFISSLGSGGAERQLSFLANHLSQKTAVSIFHFGLSSEVPFFPISNKVEIIGLEIYGSSNSFFSKIKNVINRIRILRSTFLSQEENTCFVSFMDKTNVLCLLASRFLSVDLIVCERSDPAFQPTCLVTRFIRDVIYRSAKKVIVQSVSAQKFFGPSLAVVVIPNMVEHSSQPLLRGLSSNECRFICVARLSREKQVVPLIRAFTHLVSSHPGRSLSLDIFGDGELRDDVEREIATLPEPVSCHYLGLDRRLKERLNDYTALLLNSLYEGFPNVIVESLSVGVPVVATKTAGSQEIKKYVSSPALLICDEIGAGLERFLEHRPTLQECEEAAKQVKEGFSQVSVLSKWSKVLDI